MTIRKHVKTVVIVFVIAFIIIPDIIRTERESEKYEIAQISDISVGYMLNNEIYTTEIIPYGTHQIFVCGTITTRGSNYLGITLHSSDEKYYYGKGKSDKPYEKGDFCREIVFNNSSRLSRGFYKVIVIDQHKRVAELLFEVR